MGDHVGPYELQSLLGEGATGLVFRALHRHDETVVALKILRAQLAADGMYVRRFLREVRVAREVRSEHIVPVVDSGVSAGRYYFASLYVEGRSLADRLREEGPLPLGDCLSIAQGVAAGLDALHEHGLIHRDVKPANIMLGPDGRAALTDFGLARGHAYTVLTTPGRPVGTPDYMAPELFLGETATASSDVYALGCVVYACLTGCSPFGGRRLIEVAAAHLDEAPRPPHELRDDLAPEASWVVLRALEKDAGKRPPTATAFTSMLGIALRQRSA